MKRYIMIFPLVCLSGCVLSNVGAAADNAEDAVAEVNADSVAIDGAVRGWVDAVNSRDYTRMHSLLASEVKFYTQVYTPEKVVGDERMALEKSPDFKEYVASGIEIVKTSSDEVRATYTKHTSHDGKAKSYQAYMRLIKDGERWLISEISDETTDKNIKKRSGVIPENAIAGDFNGDGRTEYVWIEAEYDDDGYAVSPLRLVSDAVFIPDLKWEAGIMGVSLENLGSLDGSGRDYLGAIPYAMSTWCRFETYELDGARWTQPIETFIVWLGGDETTKRVQRVNGQPGYVRVIYNVMDGEDFSNHVKTEKLK